MSVESEEPIRAKSAGASRKPRADGQRNRDRLVEAAKAGFAEAGSDVSLEEIARRAGVGIGTLYRHFPTRAAIVEAVYRREVQHLADSATRLLESMSPGDALRQWLRLSVDLIATKRIVASALGGETSDLYAASGPKIIDAMTSLVERAAASGDIRPDVEADDLLRALVGFTYGADRPGWQASAVRLIDVLMDGLASPRPI